jgi:hypothetical protein
MEYLKALLGGSEEICFHCGGSGRAISDTSWLTRDLTCPAWKGRGKVPVPFLLGIRRMARMGKYTHDVLIKNGLMWQKKCDGVERTQKEALAYCRSLSLAGYRDWHLPTLQEFELLGKNVEEPDREYWTATDEPRLSKDIAYINDGTTMFRTNQYYVLAVRNWRSVNERAG